VQFSRCTNYKHSTVTRAYERDLTLIDSCSYNIMRHYMTFMSKHQQILSISAINVRFSFENQLTYVFNKRYFYSGFQKNYK